MENEFTFRESRARDCARGILFEVLELLDAKGVTYHLEGGTLLGFVRDGDLLPWDHDLDISIPSGEVDRLLACRWAIRRRGLRVSAKPFESDGVCWKKGDLRHIKIRNRRWGFWSAPVCLDIFVKYRDEKHVYWVARNKVMRVPARHYLSFETVSVSGRSLKAPNDHQGYLQAKYGDWRTPVKEWDCRVDELTVIGDA